jgi:hypothetical protein
LGYVKVCNTGEVMVGKTIEVDAVTDGMAV